MYRPIRKMAKERVCVCEAGLKKEKGQCDRSERDLEQTELGLETGSLEKQGI